MNDMPERKQYLPSRRPAIFLSHIWPRVTAAGKDRMTRHLGEGCRCGSTRATITRRVIAGSPVPHLQCNNCGKSLSGSMQRVDHPDLESYQPWDDDRGADYYQQKQVDQQRQTAGLIEKVKLESSELKEEYHEWLRTSPAWRQTCLAVRRRANNTCEACLSGPIDAVHHLTYALGALPPAWELRGVCRECHDRIHADKHGHTDPWCPTSFKDNRS